MKRMFVFIAALIFISLIANISSALAFDKAPLGEAIQRAKEFNQQVKEQMGTIKQRLQEMCDAGEIDEELSRQTMKTIILTLETSRTIIAKLEILDKKTKFSQDEEKIAEEYLLLIAMNQEIILFALKTMKLLHEEGPEKIKPETKPKRITKRVA